MAVGDEEKGYGSVEPSAPAPRAAPSAEAERSTRREARLHVAGVTTVVLICSALIFGAVMYFPAQANAHAPFSAAHTDVAAAALPSPVAAWNSTATVENTTLPTDTPGRVDGPRGEQADALPSPVAAWNSTTTTENATLPTDAPGRVDGPHL